MSITREPTMIVINNGYEKRYFYSAAQAAAGLGWLVWPSGKSKVVGYYQPDQPEPGEVQVYRLDTEATEAVTRALVAADKPHDPSTGKWMPATKNKLRHIIHTLTGIKELR